MQSKEELELWYKTPDPWGYETHPDDKVRRRQILSLLFRYDRALDIGAGEGFVTTKLPADEIHGIEISDAAAKRFPENVKRVHKPEGKYDLVMTTGTLYEQYDHAQIVEWINTCANKHVLICGIKEWLLPYKFGQVLIHKEFPYREYTQSLTLYAFSTQYWDSQSS